MSITGVTIPWPTVSPPRQQKEYSASVRIGELLNIQSAVMVETIRCREDLEIFKLFDAFEKDDYFFHMIRNI